MRRHQSRYHNQEVTTSEQEFVNFHIMPVCFSKLRGSYPFCHPIIVHNPRIHPNQTPICTITIYNMRLHKRHAQTNMAPHFDETCFLSNSSQPLKFSSIAIRKGLIPFQTLSTSLKYGNTRPFVNSFSRR